MLDTMESIKSVRPIAVDDQRWSSQVLLNCNQCGEPNPANEAAVYVFRLTDTGCTCRKCMHAYSCFRILVEHTKATRFMVMLDRSDDKAREAKIEATQIQANIASEAGQKASQSYRAKYGEDWRKQMYKVMPIFDIHLKVAQGKPDASTEVADAKRRGFLL